MGRLEGTAKDGCNSGDAHAPRRLSRHVSRVLLHRGLPGTLVVFAALSVPEFSVGAGDFGSGSASDLDPPEPLVSRLQPRSPRWAGLVDGKPQAAAERLRRVAKRSARPLAPALAAPIESPVTAPGQLSPQRVDFGNLAKPALVPAPAGASPGSAALSTPPASGAPEEPRYGLASLAGAPAGARGSFASLLPETELASLAVAAPHSMAMAPAVPASQGAAAQPGASVARPKPVAAAAPIVADKAAATAQMAVAGTSSASAPTARLAAATPRPVPGANAAAQSPAQRLGIPHFDTKARLVTRIDGKAAGTVDFRQTPGGLQVRIGSVVDVLADRYDATGLARIRASSAADSYVSLAQLQGQGIPISYDPVYDEFNVGLTDTRPKAARKVHIDQISAPERGAGAIGIDQVQR